jgi:hypothetical protein
MSHLIVHMYGSESERERESSNGVDIIEYAAQHKSTLFIFISTGDAVPCIFTITHTHTQLHLHASHFQLVSVQRSN